MTAFRMAVIATALATAGCVSMPTGPSMTALPGTGKHFDQFRADDMSCRQYAYESIGGHTPARAQADTAVMSGVAGAAIGALLGAAAGGGNGAAIGAAAGAGVGGIAGASAGHYAGRDAQGRYDGAYKQCMYARGHKVPVAARYSSPYYYPSPYSAPPAPGYVPPPRTSAPPPPPPGAAPPPPPPGSAPRV